MKANRQGQGKGPRQPYGSRRALVEDGLAESIEAVRLARQRERRRKDRLEAIPQSRQCPCCGKVKLETKAWVAFVDRARVTAEAVAAACTRLGISPAVGAVCRACWWRATHEGE